MKQCEVAKNLLADKTCDSCGQSQFGDYCYIGMKGNDIGRKKKPWSKTCRRWRKRIGNT
jgi:hypothetical protein